MRAGRKLDLPLFSPDAMLLAMCIFAPSANANTQITSEQVSLI
jgi:hypothetical protein